MLQILSDDPLAVATDHAITLKQLLNTGTLFGLEEVTYWTAVSLAAG